jgi:hypothetical protein
MAGFFGGGGMGQPPQQQPDKPTQDASMMQIVDEWRNRYTPYVMETYKDPITGGDKPADIATFVEWRKTNPPLW